MPAEHERELGEQPIAQLMTELGLDSAALVSASTEQLTFKMVAKAQRGRYLTMNVRLKVLRAIQKAAANPALRLEDLFNYRSRPSPIRPLRKAPSPRSGLCRLPPSNPLVLPLALLSGIPRTENVISFSFVDYNFRHLASIG